MRETEMRETHALYSSVPQSTSDTINFRIKNSEDNSSWDIEGEGCWTVHQLKMHVKEKFKLQNKRVRLIMLGRLLEDSNTLSFYGIKDGDFVHAAISEEPPPPPPETVIAIPARRERREAEGDEDGEERGFDRLVHSGFTQQEIDFLRAQFHARRGTHGAPEEEMTELEEAWLEQNQQQSILDGGRSDRRSEMRGIVEASEGTQADMLLGMVMGFVFGVIMLFWIWERGIPRRQKIGILCGIGCNVTMGMIRLQSRAHGAGRVAGGD